jgi:hypothetical protein
MNYMCKYTILFSSFTSCCTFLQLALGAGLLIVGGIFYFLQLERDRLNKQ